MKLDFFKYVIDEAKMNLFLASRGDPLVAPNIIKMLEDPEEIFLNLKINQISPKMKESVMLFYRVV